MNILIADDHAIVRKGIAQIVHSIPYICNIDEASNGDEVLTKFESNKYELVILDLSMPKKNGLDTLKILIEKDHSLKVLILSIYPEEQYAVKAFKNGAFGYMTKNAAALELKNAILQIINGNKYITNSLAEKIISVKDFEKPLHERLSEREYQTMVLTSKGKTVNQIAKELNISPKTVSTYKSRILEKMNFSNFSQVILYMINNKL